MRMRPLVGDLVHVTKVDWTERRAVVHHILPRQRESVDPPVANFTQLLTVFSLTQPELDMYQLSRFLVAAEALQVPLVLALNKADLVTPEFAEWAREEVRSWGYEPIFVSAATAFGMEPLRCSLRDHITVVAGPSGVGKSSLINTLTEMAEWVDSEPAAFQAVGEVSARSGRGKHTTRHISFIRLAEGGLLADTPGFTQPTLDAVKPIDLSRLFPEIREALSTGHQCRFKDCLHREEPDCVVPRDWPRYQLYLSLLEEVEEADRVARRQSKADARVKYKTGSDGVRQPEAMLNKMQYRRTSRKKMKQDLMAEALQGLEEEDSDVGDPDREDSLDKPSSWGPSL
eukprot:scaffold3713_cov372-Prasinococcus_capsulatus_cf.AAC.15